MGMQPNVPRTSLRAGSGAYIQGRIQLTGGTALNLVQGSDGITFNATDSEIVNALIAENAIQELEIIELQADASISSQDQGSFVKDTFSDSNGYLDSVDPALTTAFYNNSSGKYARASGAVQFVSANNDSASFDDATDLTVPQEQGLIMSFWFKPSTISGTQALMTFEASSGSINGFFVNGDSSVTTRLYLKDAPGDLEAEFISSSTVNTADWHHIFVGQDESNGDLYFYLNNTLEGSEASGGAGTEIDFPTSSTAQAEIGMNNGSQYYNGFLQELQIYSDAFIGGLGNFNTELAELWNSGNGTSSTLSNGFSLLYHSHLNGNFLDASGNGVSVTNSGADSSTAGFVDQGTQEVEITLPTITGEVTHTYLFVNDPDREAGDSIVYDLVDAASAEDTGLSISDEDTLNKNALSNVDGTNMSGGKMTIRLNEGTAETAGVPSVKSYVLVLVKS